MCGHMPKPIKREQLKKAMDNAKQVLFGIGPCKCHEYNRHHHHHHHHHHYSHHSKHSGHSSV